jgi:hypothetical protein
MRWFVALALAGPVIAYSLAVHQAGAAASVGDGKCYVFTDAGPGCECSDSGCGACIQLAGGGKECQPLTYSQCYRQQDTTEVKCGGYLYQEIDKPCGAKYMCVAPTSCPGTCTADGCFYEALPGYFCQAVAGDDCPIGCGGGPHVDP